MERWDGSTWTEITDLNVGRGALLGYGQTSDVALAVGGYSPSPAEVALTESWNGTSWTEIADTAAPRGATKGPLASSW